MTINFKNIPQNIRVPLFYAEVDNSQANTAIASQRTLIIGQVTAAAISAGTVPNVPIISQGVQDAVRVGGNGSMLALMTAAYRANDNFGEVWYLPLADDPNSFAASGTLTVVTPPTTSGTLNVYIAGNLVAVPVLPTQTPTQIALALATSINSAPGMPLVATAITNIVNLLAINQGPAGNEIDVRLNYLGPIAGEVQPTGLQITVTPMTKGATPPSLTLAFANLLDKPFDFIVLPYTDPTSLTAVATLLNDVSGRWSWARQIYGHAFAAYRGTLGGLTTFGLTVNNQHTTVMGFNDSPTPAWIWASALAGQVAVSVRSDPALPLKTLALTGVLPPPVVSRFALTDRNVLLYDGISTFTTGDDGTVRIELLITTYQTNAYGQPDNSYLKVETLYTLAYLLRGMAVMVTSKYGRVKLAANGTRFGPGANVVTPNIIRGDLIALYRTYEDAGLVQNGNAFKTNLVVQQNAQNPNRVDVLWPGTIINQLDIFAVLAQFRLQ